MGLFNKFFKKSDSGSTNNFKNTTEMLDEDIFWEIIHKSIKASRNQDEQLKSLNKLVYELEPQQIIGFNLSLYYLKEKIYSSDMWCAAYLINGGCSDDAFDYFRCWVISKGKDVYYKAKEHPDSLADSCLEHESEKNFEDLLSVAPDAFTKKTGKDIYAYMLMPLNDDDSDIEIDWEEDRPESMQKICPVLFEQYN